MSLWFLKPTYVLMQGIPVDLHTRAGDLGAVIDGTLAGNLGWGLDVAAYPRPYRMFQAGRRLGARLGVAWPDSSDAMLDASSRGEASARGFV
jgi:hypothetical protein